MAWTPKNTVEDALFRPLTDEEEEQFREYARNNPPPEDKTRLSVMHPVCRDEWEKLDVKT